MRAKREVNYMSQKMKITGVKHIESPVYLGDVNGTDSYSSNPYQIMNWLCDGYRTRFNHHRSKRMKYNSSGDLVPIGHTVVDVSDKQSRERYSFLSAIPAMILQAPEKKENEEWFSAVKRKKKSGGTMPRFKSRKVEDQKFVCWHNNGKNAVFRKTGKKTGIVVISGQNPVGKRDKGTKWKLQIRVKITQDVRKYTSILVNWTQGTIVFVNQPERVSKTENTSQVIGLDRGGVVPVATSDGDILLPDKKLLKKYEKRRKYHQKQMGKARVRARKRGGKSAVQAVMQGSRYQENKFKAQKYYRKAASYRESWIQEITTHIVRNNGVIVMEDLDTKSMTKKGGSRKKGMNRTFLEASPARIAQCLEYKSLLSGRRVVYIPAEYTSQRCSKCGYTNRNNRESQSVFVCGVCNHTENADTNAARNIAAYYEYLIEGTDLPAYDPYDHKNDSGEVVRPTAPQGVRKDFYIFDQGCFSDTVDPVNAVGGFPHYAEDRSQ